MQKTVRCFEASMTAIRKQYKRKYVSEFAESVNVREKACRRRRFRRQRAVERRGA